MIETYSCIGSYDFDYLCVIKLIGSYQLTDGQPFNHQSWCLSILSQIKECSTTAKYSLDVENHVVDKLKSPGKLMDPLPPLKYKGSRGSNSPEKVMIHV